MAAVARRDAVRSRFLQGLTCAVLDFHGKHYDFNNVPMELSPLQKPHPPVWYGVHAPDSAVRAAKRALHVIDLDPTAETRLAIDAYRATAAFFLREL